MRENRHALWLSALLLATLTFSFPVRLKREPEPQLIDRISEHALRASSWNGKMAPDLELTMLDGSSFKLSEHVGSKVVILNFFATWCAPCRAEMPELERFNSALGDKPVMLIGIDAAEEPQLVRQFLDELHVTFPVGIDAGTIAQAYGVRSYPTTVVIGADGRVQLYETTAILNTEVAFRDVLDRNVAEIRAGRGITATAYAAATGTETYFEVRDEPSRSDDIALTGRAATIAATMSCVCGCSDTVEKCSCNTATKIKKKLAEGDFGDRSDAEIKTVLNAEFCMKEGM